MNIGVLGTGAVGETVIAALTKRKQIKCEALKLVSFWIIMMQATGSPMLETKVVK